MSRRRPFPADTDVQSWLERHDNLRRLYKQIKDYKIWHLPPDALQSLGIHASQVDLTDGEDLQFSPCFFRPHPGKQLIPRLRSWWGDDSPKWPLEDHPFPTWNEVLKSCQEVPAFAGDYLYYANSIYKKELERWVGDQTDMLQRARELFEYIDDCIDLYAGGPPEGLMDNAIGCPQELPDAESWWPKPGLVQPALEQRSSWEVKRLQRCLDNGFPKSHMIVSIAADIHATGPEQDLTLHEVKAIVNLMVIRVTQSPFRRCRMHPVLAFSYMGRQCGRIIQALYDGEVLSIQRSKLFSFDDEEMAPVELFLRYRLSKPVELANPALCPR